MKIIAVCVFGLYLTACSAEQSAKLGPQQSSATERKVFIDPETGRVIAPTQQDAPPPRQNRRTPGEVTEKIITGPNGAKFLIHNPNNRSELKAEQNADGEVTIEHKRSDR